MRKRKPKIFEIEAPPNVREQLERNVDGTHKGVLSSYCREELIRKNFGYCRVCGGAAAKKVITSMEQIQIVERFCNTCFDKGKGDYTKWDK